MARMKIVIPCLENWSRHALGAALADALAAIAENHGLAHEPVHTESVDNPGNVAWIITIPCRMFLPEAGRGELLQALEAHLRRETMAHDPIRFEPVVAHLEMSTP